MANINSKKLYTKRINLRHFCTVPKELNICCTYKWITRMSLLALSSFCHVGIPRGRIILRNANTPSGPEDGLRERLEETIY